MPREDEQVSAETTCGTPERQISEAGIPSTPHDHIPVLYGLGPVIDDPSSPSPAHTHNLKRSPRKRHQKKVRSALARVRDMQRMLNELACDLEDLLE